MTVKEKLKQASVFIFGRKQPQYIPLAKAISICEEALRKQRGLCSDEFGNEEHPELTNLYLAIKKIIINAPEPSNL